MQDELIQAHDECVELLPWLVNGSLTEEQSLRLRAHLQNCAECRGELAEQTRVSEHVLRADTVIYAPQPSLQKLMARLEEPSTIAQEPLPQTQRPVRLRANRWLMAAILVEAIGIGLLAGALLWKNAREQAEPRFATLTSSSAPGINAPTVRIVFTPGAPAEQINTLVRSVGAQIVAGPSEADVYTLSLPTTKDDAAVAADIARLRADSRVRFAEIVVRDFRETR